MIAMTKKAAAMLFSALSSKGRATLLLVLGLTLLPAVPRAQGQEESGASGGEQPPNVLFIAVDDLRPQLESYGKPRMHTPNIDRLAAEGVRFPNHFVQAPTCGASRYAMLMSRRPHPSRPATYGNGAFSLLAERDSARPRALPHHFRHHGYHTVGIGKISHSPDGRRHEKTTRPDATDDPEAPPQMPDSWDEVYGPRGSWNTAWRAFFAYAGGMSRDRGKTPPVEAADVPDTGYPDGLTANMAVDELRERKGREQPFFMAVGFYKPHLPFNAPQRYWDRYDRNRIGLAPHPAPPTGVDPAVSGLGSGELFGGYGGVVWDDSITAAEARKLRHGYYAATSYVDAQIGTVLDALEQLDLKENTIVVLWGDHGWHLGDLSVWGKHTTHDFSLRSPLIVRAPGVTPPAGAAARTVVESVDLYPTLAELCGLPVPEAVDGESLMPFLKRPDRPSEEAAAFGYWRSQGDWGKTVRIGRYRLTRWANDEGKRAQVELYDHRVDPNETENVADQHPAVVRRLMRRLKMDDQRVKQASSDQ
jgi:arylsulfatase A-like enzyme